MRATATATDLVEAITLIRSYRRLCAKTLSVEERELLERLIASLTARLDDDAT